MVNLLMKFILSIIIFLIDKTKVNNSKSNINQFIYLKTEFQIGLLIGLGMRTIKW